MTKISFIREYDHSDCYPKVNGNLTGIQCFWALLDGSRWESQTGLSQLVWSRLIKELSRSPFPSNHPRSFSAATLHDLEQGHTVPLWTEWNTLRLGLSQMMLQGTIATWVIILTADLHSLPRESWKLPHKDTHTRRQTQILNRRRKYDRPSHLSACLMRPKAPHIITSRQNDKDFSSALPHTHKNRGRHARALIYAQCL